MLLSELNKTWSDAELAIKSFPFWERFVVLFWLFGPLIMLIERTPADIWLTLLSLIFVFRQWLKKEASFLKIFWVRATFTFWFVCLLSAACSNNPVYSIGEAFAWIRFPVFAMACAFWLGQDKRILNAMLAMTVLGLLSICFILSLELLIEGQKNGRLTWPYGDPIPGSYLSKACLPAFIISVTFAVSKGGRAGGYSGIFSLVTLILSLMTGERINFLIRACAGMLAALLWKPNFQRYFILVAIELFALVFVFQAFPTVSQRYVDEFVSDLPIHEESPYLKAFKPGFDAFVAHPILGVGPANYASECYLSQGENVATKCQPHPHNFFIQLAGETGIFGLLAGTTMIISILWSVFARSRKTHSGLFDKTAFVIPLALFWPIASTADFFGQMNNIFLWSAVAISLCAGARKQRMPNN